MHPDDNNQAVQIVLEVSSKMQASKINCQLVVVIGFYKLNIVNFQVDLFYDDNAIL